LKPNLSESAEFSASELILAFKGKLSTVTEKFFTRVKVNPVPGALHTYARIVVKLLVDLVGEEVLMRLVIKSVKGGTEC
jgi:hypothetical protein